ncbi:MAG TPA: hypothetical protein VH142_17080 [Polyangiaceae bacterium]|jgi:hypothetical protein|nr:hypothetical protein [Polyangiaceae bacterium]
MNVQQNLVLCFAVLVAGGLLGTLACSSSEPGGTRDGGTDAAPRRDGSADTGGVSSTGGTPSSGGVGETGGNPSNGGVGETGGKQDAGGSGGLGAAGGSANAGDAMVPDDASADATTGGREAGVGQDGGARDSALPTGSLCPTLCQGGGTYTIAAQVTAVCDEQGTLTWTDNDPIDVTIRPEGAGFRITLAVGTLDVSGTNPLQFSQSTLADTTPTGFVGDLMLSCSTHDSEVIPGDFEIAGDCATGEVTLEGDCEASSTCATGVDYGLTGGAKSGTTTCVDR